MKKLLLILLLTSCIPSLSYGQSETQADSVGYFMPDTYKEFGDFILDISLFSILPIQTPEIKLKSFSYTKDFNKIFKLDPSTNYSGSSDNSFFSIFSSTNINGSSFNIQKGTFKLKNGIRINTYGEYNATGYKVPNRNALPWERNNFKGAFEIKSSNGNFGVRIEVQQGKATPY